MSAQENTESASSNNADAYLVQRLHSSLEKTRKRFLACIKFSLFEKRYSDIYNTNPGELKRIYDEWISQIDSSISEDVKEICADYSIDFLLLSLEKINANQHSQISWRPSGNPDEDLRDHIYPIKVNHKKNLEEILNKLQIVNEEMSSVAAVQHAEIMLIKKENEELHRKFSEIVSSASGLQNLQENFEKVTEDL